MTQQLNKVAKPEPLGTTITPIPLAEQRQSAAAGFARIAGVTTASEILVQIDEGVVEVMARDEKRTIAKERRVRHGEALKLVPTLMIRFGAEAEARGMRAQTENGTGDPVALKAAESLFRDIPDSVIEFKYPIRDLLFQVREDLNAVILDPSKTKEDMLAATERAKTMEVAVRITGGWIVRDKKRKVVGVQALPAAPSDTIAAPLPNPIVQESVTPSDSDSDESGTPIDSGDQKSPAPTNINTSQDMAVLLPNPETVDPDKIEDIKRVELPDVDDEAHSEPSVAPHEDSVGSTAPAGKDPGSIPMWSVESPFGLIGRIIDDRAAQDPYSVIAAGFPIKAGGKTVASPAALGGEYDAGSILTGGGLIGTPTNPSGTKPVTHGSPAILDDTLTIAENQRADISQNAITTTSPDAERVALPLRNAIGLIDAMNPDRVNRSTPALILNLSSSVAAVATEPLPFVSDHPAKTPEMETETPTNADQVDDSTRSTPPRGSANAGAMGVGSVNSGLPPVPCEAKPTASVLEKVEPVTSVVISRSPLIRGPKLITQAELEKLPGTIRSKTNRITDKTENLRSGLGKHRTPKSMVDDWIVYENDLEAKMKGLGLRMRQHAQALFRYDHPPSDDMEFLEWMTKCQVKPPKRLLGLLWKRIEWRG